VTGTWLPQRCCRKCSRSRDKLASVVSGMAGKHQVSTGQPGPQDVACGMPHDFRRIFATQAVNEGLPVHIVARFARARQHQHVAGCIAVFDQELIKTYRSFVERRRASRPNRRVPPTHR
jgi:hypothetical protein